MHVALPLMHEETCIISTVEPRYNEVHVQYYENYLVISGFSLYQGKKAKTYNKELGPAKLPCYKRVCYIRPLNNKVPLFKD